MSIGDLLNKSELLLNDSLNKFKDLTLASQDSKSCLSQANSKLLECNSLLNEYNIEFNKNITILCNKLGVARGIMRSAWDSRGDNSLSQLSNVKCAGTGKFELYQLEPLFRSIIENIEKYCNCHVSDNDVNLVLLRDQFNANRADMLNLSKQLNVCTYSVLRAEECVHDNGMFTLPQDKYGYLFLELVTPYSKIETVKYNRALLQLLQPHWNTRVAVTEEMTKTLLQLPTSNGEGTVIWPTYRLIVPFCNYCDLKCVAIESMYTENKYSNHTLIDLLHKLAGKYCQRTSVACLNKYDLVDPISLLQWNKYLIRDVWKHDLEKALKKAVAQWIFVTDDAVANIMLELLKSCNDNTMEVKYGYVLGINDKKMLQGVNGFITADGRRYVLGSLFVQNFRPIEDCSDSKIQQWKNFTALSSSFNATIESFSLENFTIESNRKQITLLKKLSAEAKVLWSSLIEVCINNNEQWDTSKRLTDRCSDLKKEVYLNEKLLADTENHIESQNEIIRNVEMCMESSQLSLTDSATLLDRTTTDVLSYKSKLIRLKNDAEGLNLEIMAYDLDISSLSDSVTAIDDKLLSIHIYDKNCEIQNILFRLEKLKENDRDLNNKLLSLEKRSECISDQMLSDGKQSSKSNSILKNIYKEWIELLETVNKNKSTDLKKRSDSVSVELYEAIRYFIRSCACFEDYSKMELEALLYSSGVESAPFCTALDRRIATCNENISTNLTALKTDLTLLRDEMNRFSSDEKYTMKDISRLMEVIRTHLLSTELINNKPQIIAATEEIIQLLTRIKDKCDINKQMIIVEMYQHAAKNALLPLNIMKALSQAKCNTVGADDAIIDLLHNGNIRLQIETVGYKINMLKQKYDQVVFPH